MYQYYCYTYHAQFKLKIETVSQFSITAGFVGWNKQNDSEQTYISMF